MRKLQNNIMVYFNFFFFLMALSLRLSYAFLLCHVVCVIGFVCVKPHACCDWICLFKATHVHAHAHAHTSAPTHAKLLHKRTHTTLKAHTWFVSG